MTLLTEFESAAIVPKGALYGGQSSSHPDVDRHLGEDRKIGVVNDFFFFGPASYRVDQENWNHCCGH